MAVSFSFLCGAHMYKRWHAQNTYAKNDHSLYTASYFICSLEENLFCDIFHLTNGNG